MKRSISLSVLSLVMLSGATQAADLPSIKAPPPPPPPVVSWTGMYAGLNAGYSWGTNGSVTSQNIAPSWLENAPELGEPWVSASGPRAMSGVASMTQSGFIGGAQFGYNYQWSPKFVVGIETDIQGTGIYGTSSVRGGAAITEPYNQGTNPVNCCQTSSAATGATVVDAGLNYLGTVRGRIGYLWTPTMLLYGTGGFSYGGAYAKVGQTAFENLGYPLNLPGVATAYSTTTWTGGGRQSQILTGWNAGGGVEWMFMPNWSLKAEAMYWDLGRMNVNTATFAPSGQQTFGGYLSNSGLGRTSVSYSGVQAKVGVNYHFNWASTPVVASY